MKSTQKIYDAMKLAELEKNETTNKIGRLLREFIVDNTPAKDKKELQMNEFLPTDKFMKELRPYMCCVCMDNEMKVAVATDSYVMFVSKSKYVDYGRDEKRTFVDEYGEVVTEEMRYPNWSAVFPTDLVPIKVFDDIDELIRNIEIDMKKEGVKKIDNKVILQISEECWVRLKYAKLMQRAGWDGWMIQNQDNKKKHGGNMAMLKEWDGNRLLVMSVMAPTHEEDLERWYRVDTDNRREKQ